MQFFILLTALVFMGYLYFYQNSQDAQNQNEIEKQEIYEEQKIRLEKSKEIFRKLSCNGSITFHDQKNIEVSCDDGNSYKIAAGKYRFKIIENTP